MNWLDYLIILILLFFIWKGFRAGLVGAIGGFLGIVVGIWAGSHFMAAFGSWLTNAFHWDNLQLANIIAFVAIFLAVNIIFSIIVWIINKIFNIIPFIDLANKLAGAVIGFIGGVLAVAALIYLMSIFSLSESFNQTLTSSQLADLAVAVAVIVKPLIPEAIKSLKSIL